MLRFYFLMFNLKKKLLFILKIGMELKWGEVPFDWLLWIPNKSFSFHRKKKQEIKQKKIYIHTFTCIINSSEWNVWVFVTEFYVHAAHISAYTLKTMPHTYNAIEQCVIVYEGKRKAHSSYESYMKYTIEAKINCLNWMVWLLLLLMLLLTNWLAGWFRFWASYIMFRFMHFPSFDRFSFLL